MEGLVSPPKNPLRVAAGRMNVRLRRPWSEGDRSRQRKNAVSRQPWRHSTGPTTPDGKLRSAANGHKHVCRPGSRREAQRSVLDVHDMIAAMREMRQR